MVRGSLIDPSLTPLVHLMPFSVSGASSSSMKVIRLSLLRSGGVMERPGEAEGVATGVGLRLLRRMDWGVKAENTGPEAAKARARWGGCTWRASATVYHKDCVKHLKWWWSIYIVLGNIKTVTEQLHLCTHFDNLRCLKQTEFRCFADALWRNPGAGRSGRTEKRPRALTGGMYHQIHQPESQWRGRMNAKHSWF